jgi:hypothetical protein
MLETIEQPKKKKKKQEEEIRTKCLEKCIKSSNFEMPHLLYFSFVCFQCCKMGCQLEFFNPSLEIELCSRILLSSNTYLCQIEYLFFQIEHYFQTSYFSLFFCPFWAIFMILDVPLIRGSQYIFELQMQSNYIPRILYYLIIKCLKVSLSTL